MPGTWQSRPPWSGSGVIGAGSTMHLPWSDDAEYVVHDAVRWPPREHHEPWVLVTCWCEAEVVRVPRAVFDRRMTVPCHRAECVRFDVEIHEEERAS